MTATEAPVRPPRGAPFSPVTAGRLLRLELRRNAMPWMVPLLIALFLFDPYRTSMGYPPVWDLRASVVLNKLLPDFVAFAAGVSAWMGSRDSRRHISDLVAATARPNWARQGATLAATLGWVAAAYLGCVAVLYGVTAAQATWGGPPWWPVAVGVAALAALCTAGFAAGAVFPSRFTPPLAAVGAFLLSLVAFKDAVGRPGSYAVLSPSTSVPNLDIGVFYRYLPDVAIAQLMFLGGLTAVALGVFGLSRTADGGVRLRRAAAAAAAAGLAATGTAIGLAGTARLEAHGVVIPALHDAASDQPIPYTPACRQAAVPVCVHPAFRSYLAEVTAAVRPVLGEVAGLPGAPARVTQAAINGLGYSTANISGTPAVFHFTMPPTPGSFGQTAATFTGSLRAALVTAFVTSGGRLSGTPEAAAAQQALQAALLQTAGVPLAAQHEALGFAPPPNSGILAAARRFAALPAPARHAWLATHLAALRAGHVTLAQLP